MRNPAYAGETPRASVWGPQVYGIAGNSTNAGEMAAGKIGQAFEAAGDVCL